VERPTSQGAVTAEGYVYNSDVYKSLSPIAFSNGEICTMRQLAKWTGFNENYVSRILGLVYFLQTSPRPSFAAITTPPLTVAHLTATLELDWGVRNYLGWGGSTHGSAA
jgi:hypothetical protein